MNLPIAYLDYRTKGHLSEAFLTDEFAGYMMLWPVENVEQFNMEYEVPKHAPGFLCFGSNGGGELLAFDENGAIFCIPAIGMEPKYAKRIADSWPEFERYIER